MSWDVVMIRTKTNSEAIDEIHRKNIIPFKQTEIAAIIKKMSVKIQIPIPSCCISEVVNRTRYLLF